MFDDSLQAYTAGHADGAARHHDQQQADHPETGADYRVGVTDGSLAAFQSELVAEVRRVLGDPH
ncbi:hypothetical protein [Actinoplanes sp. DH11]|uniref:hypothetical protein n=1 Tax=Actinoplanes sp. DH11 TaxID=2857011 RepID=UPI001E4C0D07|nr:hypothetical protein [Actinoplanes sp. DH11]